MNKSTKEMLYAFDRVSSLFGGCLVLTGSAALSLYGLTDDVPKDIDCIINIDLLPKYREFIEKLDTREDKTIRTRKGYEVEAVFEDSGFRIDLFSEERDPGMELIIGGRRVNKITCILEARARFGRKKDLDKFDNLISLLKRYEPMLTSPNDTDEEDLKKEDTSLPDPHGDNLPF